MIKGEFFISKALNYEKKTQDLILVSILTYLQNHIQNIIPYTFFFVTLPFFWISLRPISSNQLHALLHFHPCPIYLVFFKGSWDISS